MPTGTEAFARQSQIEAALDSGIEQISARQEVEFRQYTRFALGPDSSVFWIATPRTMVVTGSLHYMTDRVQDVDQTIGANHVVFTSISAVSEFNVVDPSTMWIGTWPIDDSPPLRVVFAQRGNFFQQADVWHYSGYAVYPALETQIVDDPRDLPQGPIVSNSLPIFLAHTQFSLGTQLITVPVYPSYLVPDNAPPPYISVHIEPGGTEALGAFPIVEWPGTVVPDSGGSPFHSLPSSQLARDHVTLILYGFTNQMAIAYFQSLVDYSLTDAFGFANSPIPIDDKRPQTELATIAQKKTITIHANYYQGSADAVARRLITSAYIENFSIVGGIVPEGVGAGAQDSQTALVLGTVGE